MDEKKIKQQISLIVFIAENSIPIAGIWVDNSATERNEKMCKEIFDLFATQGIVGLAKREISLSDVEQLKKTGPQEWVGFLNRMYEGLLTIQETKRELQQMRENRLKKYPWKPDPRQFKRNKRNWRKN